MYLLISLVNDFTLFYDKSDNNNSLHLIFPKNTLASKYNENKRVPMKTASLMKISHRSR